MSSIQVMAFPLKIWKICGIWHDADQPIWFTIYAYTIYIVLYLLFPICIGASIFFTNNFDEIIEILVVFPSTLAGLKGLFVVFQKKQLLELFQYLNEMDLEIQTIEHRSIIQKKLNESNFLVKFFYSEYCVTIVLSFIIVIMANDRSFMWPSWYPLDYEHNSIIYYGLLCYQLIASLFVAVLNTSLDTYGSALYKVLGGHLDILGMRLQQLGVVQKHPMSMKMEKHNYMELLNKKHIKECVDYHVLCIK